MSGLIGQWNATQIGPVTHGGPYGGVNGTMANAPINSLRDLSAQAQMRMHQPRQQGPRAPRMMPVPAAPEPGSQPVAAPVAAPVQPVAQPEPVTYQSNPLSVPKSPGLLGWKG